MLLTIDERGLNIARNSVLVTSCQSGDKLQSKILFLATFDLR